MIDTPVAPAYQVGVSPGPPPDLPGTSAHLASLVTRTARGDQAALAELHDLTSAGVHGLALRILRDRSAAAKVTLEVYLRARVLDAAGIAFVFAAGRRWHPAGDGAEVSPVFRDASAGHDSSLVRIRPDPAGTVVGAREVYVLDGDVRMGSGVALHAGDYWTGEASIAGSDQRGTVLVLSGAPGPR